MVLAIVIGAILTIICGGAAINAFANSEYMDGFWLTCLTAAPAVILYCGISAAVNGNLTKVEYRFPAKDFKLATEIVVNEREATINGERVFIIERDTTYVIEGLTPTFGKNTYENNTRELKKRELKTELK